MLKTKTTLKEILSDNTLPGELWEAMPDSWVRCFACGHRCKIPPGKDGICRVRFNRDGELRVPWGYIAALQLDPVEKKPFFHAYPGSKALSFGMLGCDFHCSYCQNWVTSQALRDPVAGSNPDAMTPDKFVDLALEGGARIVTSTYNEPLITSEWAVEIFRRARKAGLVTSFVSNGNGTREVLDYIQPWVDLYKIDLKGFRQKEYAQLGGVLNNVLDTIRIVYEKKIWLEVVTLLIPGFNDSDEEVREMAEFLVSVSPDIPWHVTGFHKDYRMTDPDDTPSSTLTRAAEIGYTAGLHFVYAGNRPGSTGRFENTYCPSCDELLIERWGFSVKQNRVTNGVCFKCSTPLPGRWATE